MKSINVPVFVLDPEGLNQESLTMEAEGEGDNVFQFPLYAAAPSTV